MHPDKEYMREYFLQHKSDAHIKLKEMVLPSIQEFVFMDEFLLSLYDEKSRTAVVILQEDHDHADGYYIESLLATRMEELGIQVCFVTEYQITHRIDEVKSLLTSLLHNP